MLVPFSGNELRRGWGGGGGVGVREGGEGTKSVPRFLTSKDENLG